MCRSVKEPWETGGHQRRESRKGAIPSAWEKDLFGR